MAEAAAIRSSQTRRTWATKRQGDGRVEQIDVFDAKPSTCDQALRVTTMQFRNRKAGEQTTCDTQDRRILCHLVRTQEDRCRKRVKRGATAVMKQDRQTDGHRHRHRHRHRQTETETDRQTETQTDRHRQTDTDRDRQTYRDRHTETVRDRERQRDRHRHTERETHRHTDRQKQRVTDRHRQTETETERWDNERELTDEQVSVLLRINDGLANPASPLPCCCPPPTFRIDVRRGLGSFGIGAMESVFCVLSSGRWKALMILLHLSLMEQVLCFSRLYHQPRRMGYKHDVNSLLRTAKFERRMEKKLMLGKFRMVGDAASDVWVRPSPRERKDIVFGAKVISNVAVSPKHDEDQYVLIPLPNKARLEKKDDHHFALRVVPELQIFNVWLRPYVVATVDITEEGVTISAKECKLEGSPEVFVGAHLSMAEAAVRCRGLTSTRGSTLKSKCCFKQKKIHGAYGI
eukprot:753216-Hanusia_phi.AAC.6